MSIYEHMSRRTSKPLGNASNPNPILEVILAIQLNTYYCLAENVTYQERITM